MITITVNEDSYPKVRLRRVYLLHALYEDGGAGARLDGYDYLVDLSVGRRSAREVVVALTVALPDDAPVRLNVSYGGDFVLPENVPEADREEVLRETAYEVAPAVLYGRPYRPRPRKTHHPPLSPHPAGGYARGAAGPRSPGGVLTAPSAARVCSAAETSAVR